MIDVKEQIRVYFDEVDPPFNPDDLMEQEREPSAARYQGSQRRVPGWIAAAGVAAAVLFVIGGAAVFLGGPRDSEQDPATGDPVTPITTASRPATTVEEATRTEPPPTNGAFEWTKADMATLGSVVELYGVTAFADQWIAVGVAAGEDEMADGAILLSDDGFDWIRVAEDQTALTKEAVYLVGGVTEIENGVVVLGGYVCLNTEESCGLHPAVWFSPDGKTWEQVPDDPTVFGTQGWIADATRFQGGVLAVGLRFDETVGGFSPAVWSSPDGSVWSLAWTGTVQPVFEGQAMPIIEEKPYSLMEAITVTAAGNLVGVGSVCDISEGEYVCAGAVWTSADGESWILVPDDSTVFASNQPGGQVVITDVAQLSDRLIAVGTDNGTTATVWTSADGLNWNRNELPVEMAELGELSTVTSTEQEFIASGPGWSGKDTAPGTSFWTSPDGITWTKTAELGPGLIQEINLYETGGIAVGTDLADESAGIWTAGDPGNQ